MFPWFKTQLSINQKNFLIIETHLTVAQLIKTGIPDNDPPYLYISIFVHSMYQTHNIRSSVSYFFHIRSPPNMFTMGIIAITSAALWHSIPIYILYIYISWHWHCTPIYIYTFIYIMTLGQYTNIYTVYIMTLGQSWYRIVLHGSACVLYSVH